MHSEHNASERDPVHLLQIWITPRALGLPPSYADKRLPDQMGLTVIASPDGRQGSLRINQDMIIERHRLDQGAAIMVEESPQGRHWMHVVLGAISIGDQPLAAGDAVGFSEGLDRHQIVARQRSEILLFRSL